jgi:hypothetical protein
VNFSRRALQAAYWGAPSLFCLLLYRHGFLAWFRADDFAWLGLAPQVHSFRDLLGSLFLPAAQGTLRPWSERAFFMAGFSLFGMDPLPFRIVIFVTQFANLALMAAIGTRLTGRRAAGFCAAIFWVVNGGLVEPLGWVCVYNQVMCAMFLLLAFYFLMRSAEAANAGDARKAKRFEIAQWLVFLAGFGAQELNLVYPALAAAYIVWAAPRLFRRTLPMFAVSIIYVLGHNRVAPPPRSGDYAVHLSASTFRVLATYWEWSVGPLQLKTPLNVSAWVLPAGVAVVSLALLAFAVWQLRARAWAAGFCLAWYVITVAPVLPFRDHLTEYYIYIPLIGLCWLGGWAFVEAWAVLPSSVAAGLSSSLLKMLATVLALLYVFLVLPRTLEGEEWNYRLTLRVRDLVEGVARIHELHPGKTILLDGVDTAQFYNGVLDHPYAALGIENVYLTPGSERRIDVHPDLGDIAEFVLPAEIAFRGLSQGATVVYDVTGPQLRNVTSTFAALPQVATTPQRVDAGSVLAAYLLGPEWYPIDGDHRWMPIRASLRIGGPAAPGQKLYLHGNSAARQLSEGPTVVTVTIDGAPLAPAQIPPGAESFDLSFALPSSLVGKSELHVVVEVSRTFRPAGDNRDLGLAFGIFEVR